VRVQYPGNELLLGENLPELALPSPAMVLPEPPRPEAALPEPRPRATRTANSG